MEPRFWTDVWAREGETPAFHRAEVHPFLARHLPPGRLAGARVLVPLCGMSLDLLWLRERAARVVGIELSEVAVGQLFAGSGLPFARHGDRYEAERLTVLRRDIFAVGKAEVGPVDLVYDRAALIALPPPMRLRYVATLGELAADAAAQLVITLEHDGPADRPPFSVTPADVAAYYGAAWRIDQVERVPRPDDPLVRDRGLGAVIEHAFTLTRDPRLGSPPDRLGE